MEEYSETKKKWKMVFEIFVVEKPRFIYIWKKNLPAPRAAVIENEDKYIFDDHIQIDSIIICFISALVKYNYFPTIPNIYIYPLVENKIVISRI